MPVSRAALETKIHPELTTATSRTGHQRSCADALKTGTGKGMGTGVEPCKATRWKVRSSAIWCGSGQVENNRARSAGSSYRFGNQSLGGLSRSLSGFLSAHLFPRGGALGCYRDAPSARKTLNLTCRSFGLWPTSANPIFVFFVAFVVKIIRIGTVPTSRHRHRVQWPVRSQSRKLDSTVRSCRGEVPNPEPEKP